MKITDVYQEKKGSSVEKTMVLHIQNFEFQN